MNVREILRGSFIPLPVLAERTGLSLGYLKQLSAANNEAGEKARAKLATALRDHADRLRTDADVLDPPPDSAPTPD